MLDGSLSVTWQDKNVGSMRDGQRMWEILFIPVEIEEAIRTLKSQKAPDPDEIDTKHIIYSSPLAHHLPTDLFNAIAATRHIPAAYQFGYITAIPKNP